MNHLGKLLLRSFVACAALAPLASAQSTAFKLFGSVLVFGSSGADDLWLRGSGGALSIDAGGGATVNGSSAANFSNVWGPVLVFSGSGNDFVRMTDSVRNSAVFVELGSGDDFFYAERNEFKGSLWVDGGSSVVDGDLVAMAGVGAEGNTVLGSLIITAQRATVGARDCTVVGDLVLATGSGADFLHVDGIVTVFGDVEISTGGGNDEIQFAGFSSSVGNQIHGRLKIDTGSGDDLVAIGSELGGVSAIGGASSIKTGDGADTLVIRRTNFGGSLSLRGGAQFDQVQAFDAAYGNTAASVSTLDFESVQ